MTFIVPVYRRNTIVAVTKVDATDYPNISPYQWYLKCDNSGLKYAIRYERFNGHRRGILLHRHLLGLLGSNIPWVDHKNGDGLDNRRENTRTVTPAQNGHNWHSHKTSSSPYRGVSWDKKNRKWRARVRLKNKIVVARYFEDEIEAAIYAKESRLVLMTHTVEQENPSATKSSQNYRHLGGEKIFPHRKTRCKYGHKFDGWREKPPSRMCSICRKRRIEVQVIRARQRRLAIRSAV